MTKLENVTNGWKETATTAVHNNIVTNELKVSKVRDDLEHASSVSVEETVVIRAPPPRVIGDATKCDVRSFNNVQCSLGDEKGSYNAKTTSSDAKSWSKEVTASNANVVLNDARSSQLKTDETQNYSNSQNKSMSESKYFSQKATSQQSDNRSSFQSFNAKSSQSQSNVILSDVKSTTSDAKYYLSETQSYYCQNAMSKSTSCDVKSTARDAKFISSDVKSTTSDFKSDDNDVTRPISPQTNDFRPFSSISITSDVFEVDDEEVIYHDPTEKEKPMKTEIQPQNVTRTSKSEPEQQSTVKPESQPFFDDDVEDVIEVSPGEWPSLDNPLFFTFLTPVFVSILHIYLVLICCKCR